MLFRSDITPSRKGRMVDFGDIWEIFQVLAANRGMGVIHSEDNDIVMHMYDKLIREGRVAFENLAEVHNTLSEDVSFRRVIRLAENVPGTALYMMHVSAATGVKAIREARSPSRGVAVSFVAERTCVLEISIAGSAGPWVPTSTVRAGQPHVRRASAK